MLKDRYGLPAGTSSQAALAAYDKGVELHLSANAGDEAAFNRAIAADPGFALAHAALARAQFLFARVGEARAAIARAVELAAGADERIKSHVETFNLSILGQLPKALEAVLGHIARWPRDAMVLAQALGVYGLIGFSGRREHHEEQRALLSSLAPAWGEDWWFLGYWGWSHVETGEPKRGGEIVDRALSLYPRNAHGAHARAHAFVEQGQSREGHDFVAGWLPEYDPRSLMHCHLSWHAALFELELDRPEAAFARYLKAIQPSASHCAPMPTLADGASFLWRCQLYGQGPRPLPWGSMADYAKASFPKARLAFADLHAAMAAAAVGDRMGLEQRVAELEALMKDGKLPQGPVIPVLCRMLGAFARGEDAEALRFYEMVRQDLPRCAGSHAQREVFEDTAIAAALRARRGDAALGMLEARLQRRPSARDAAWLGRAAGG
jgi:tetratricopeptide (TPR) repeat protein